MFFVLVWIVQSRVLGEVDPPVLDETRRRGEQIVRDIAISSNHALPGGVWLPRWSHEVFHQGWGCFLDFASAPAFCRHRPRLGTWAMWNLHFAQSFLLPDRQFVGLSGIPGRTLLCCRRCLPSCAAGMRGWSPLCGRVRHSEIVGHRCLQESLSCPTRLVSAVLHLLGAAAPMVSHNDSPRRGSPGSQRRPP